MHMAFILYIKNSGLQCRFKFLEYPVFQYGGVAWRGHGKSRRRLPVYINSRRIFKVWLFVLRYHDGF